MSTALASAQPAARRAIAGWIIYDLANTIFSFTIVSLHFPLWVVNDLGARDADFGLVSSLSMAAVLIASPIVGAISDQTPRRLPFLIVSTTACCVATALLGINGLVTALVFFAIANFFYQLGLIFYDALLPTVSTEQNRGTIGGLGIGLGYIGSFIGVGLGLAVLSNDPANKPLIFQLTALLFALLALPCFIWVRERPRPDTTFSLAVVGPALREMRETMGRLRDYPALGRFLLGRIFYADAANTMIAFMGIYATNELGLTERTVQLVLLLGIAAAVGGGLIWGRVVDRIGPKRCLNLVLLVWLGTLLLIAGLSYLRLPSELTWLVGALVGVSLGGTWAADRPYMLRLTPPDRLGQFYGLYNMVGRFAAILGPLIWSLIVDGLGLGRPAAVLSLVVMIIIAMLVLQPISDRPTATDAPAPG